MAIVVVAEIEGGSQELYERVNRSVMAGGELPEGSTVHIAGPIEGGWRVITVWDSEEQFNQFRQEKLIPALQEAGEGDRVEPQIQTQEVHTLLTA
jgi:hypothetical protein